jgi:hypothetical protein
MGEGGCMCVVGEKRKERQEGTWVVGKKKKEIKKKKEMRSGERGIPYTCMVGKKGEWKKKEEKKIEREKTKLVLFICLLYLVESVEL